MDKNFGFLLVEIKICILILLSRLDIKPKNIINIMKRNVLYLLINSHQSFLEIFVSLEELIGKDLFNLIVVI